MTPCLTHIRSQLITPLAKFQSILVEQISRMSTTASSSTTAPGLLKVLEGNPKRLGRVKFLAELFKERGFELRIAGGAVRDILSGKEPQDIDFATTARPEESHEIVKKHEDLLRIIETTAGRLHGTIAVKFKELEADSKRIKLDHANKPQYDDESPYEITTLRCDKVTDGRRAEVEFIRDWRQDAERRDLTINAMFLTLDEGKLIDYFDGERDLKEGIVRFVGDAEQRIREDYLRILRFFRFWSRYSRGRQPDEETMVKLRDNLDGLNRTPISGERIWQELKKTLAHMPCLAVVELMLKLKLFDHVGLKLDEAGDEQAVDYEAHTKRVLDELKLVEENVQKYARDHLNPQDKKLKELLPVILFATAVQTEEHCFRAHKRLKFSNLERDTILYIIHNLTRDPPANAYKYQLAIAPAPERHLVLQRIKAFLIYKGKFSLIEELEAWEVPTFPLSGTVVALAVQSRKLPGSRTRELIEALKVEWSKNDFNLTEEQLTAIMTEKAAQMVK